MRMKRLFGTATAAALLMTGPISATAMAQAGDPPAVPTGVGTGEVSSTLLGLDIGELLNLDLLDDLGSSTIDPTNGEPIANGEFNPLKLTSTVLDPLSLGSIATSTTGDEDSASVSDPLAGNIPLPIVSGLLEGTLSSVVDGDGARSSLLAGVGELDLVGGLLGMAASDDAVSFTTNAAPANAGGVRGLDVGSMDLLNLGNLLAGIGTPLEGLPLVSDTLPSVTGLLGGLGVDSIPVVGEGGTETDMPTDDVVATVTDLVGTLGVLDGLAPGATLEDVDEDDCLGLPVPILGELDCTALPTEGLPLVGDLTTIVEGTLIGDVVGMLEPILGGALPVLDDLDLLGVGGITAQMQSTATDSVDTSTADVVAEITSLEVAELDLLNDLGLPLLSGGGLDLTQGTNVLAGVGDTISGALNDGLGMPGLLDIDVLEITEIIEPDGDYTNALSSLTALGVNLNPANILGGVSGQQVGDLLSAGDILGDGLPLLGGDMLELSGVLDGVTSILTEGLGLEVGKMQSAGFFTPVAALPPSIVPPAAQPVTPPADGTLPRTGADTALPAVLAVILAATAIGIRRMVHTEKVEI